MEPHAYAGSGLLSGRRGRVTLWSLRYLPCPIYLHIYVQSSVQFECPPGRPLCRCNKLLATYKSRS